MTPINDYERKEYAEKVNSNCLSPEDKVYLMNESAKKFGIQMETQAEKPKTAAERQKSIEEIRKEKGQPINKSDLETLLNSFYSKEPEEINKYRAIQISALIFNDKRKINDVEYIAEAAKYFERKGNYDLAVNLAGKMGDHMLAPGIYESAYNQFVKDKRYAEAIKVAKQAKMPRDRIESCLENAKAACGKDRAKFSEVLLAYMGML